LLLIYLFSIAESDT